MNRKHYLGYMQNIESFTARGEIQIKKNKLSYDIKNGIASFRFKTRKDIDIRIIESISNKWLNFTEYRDNERGHHDSEYSLSQGFSALLSYVYHDNYSICFKVKSIIEKPIKKAKVFNLEIFSNCLLNHFYKFDDFDYNTNGFIEDTPCAAIEMKNIKFKVFRTIGVSLGRSLETLRGQFPKEFWGGFRFESNRELSNEIIYKCINAVNSYCNFVLKASGNYINNVNLENKEENQSIFEKICLTNKPNEIITDTLFSFDDIKDRFQSLLELFIIKEVDFSPLYYSNNNQCEKIDILRIASMFENQYRTCVEVGLLDYVKKEQEYKNAYLNCIKISKPTTDLEKQIVQVEIAKRENTLTSSLSNRLKFVFDKLLNVLGTSRNQIKNGFGYKFYKYDITKIANRIKDARNDIAHFLQQGIDYEIAMKDTIILQRIIYFMIFEQIDLCADKIKQIILGGSRYIQHLFGIDK